MEEENKINELENLDLQIAQKQDKIEKTQISLEYFESGEAYRENEEQYDRGEITEEEYIANKSNLDKEFDEAKENLDIAKIELKELEEKIKKQKEEFEKQKELEKLDLEIKEKEEEIEKMQITLEYFESGEAYRENEEQYDRGEITEEEYIANKSSLDKEFDEAREKMQIATEELKMLKEKRNKLIGEKEVNNANEEINLEEDEQTKLEKSIDDNIKEREEATSNSLKANSSKDGNDLDSNDEQEIEQEEIEKHQNNELEVYKKPNRFLAFFRRIIQKFKNIGKGEKQAELEEVVSNELKSEGVNISSEEIENSGFMRDLEEVYSKEEAAMNTDKRESKESIEDINKNKGDIEQNPRS